MCGIYFINIADALGMEEQSVIIDFSAAGQLKILHQNTLQMRVILLTMLNNNLNQFQKKVLKNFL